MPAGVLVWDNQAGAPSYLPLEQYDAAIASGRYKPYQESVVRTQRLGAEVDNTPDQAKAALAGGEGFVSG